MKRIQLTLDQIKDRELAILDNVSDFCEKIISVIIFVGELFLVLFGIKVLFLGMMILIFVCHVLITNDL